MTHDLKKQAEAGFDAVEEELQAISRWLYENPETAYQERASSARLVEFLTGLGFTVEYPAHGLETAFRAGAGETGPEVVICAEYDALPGVGHACGHNIIATAAAGAGGALAPLVDDLGCRLTVLGTPAEEHFGGKVDLINAGAFEGVAAAMMIHPTDRDVLDPNCLNIRHFEVEFFGEESHASSSPQVGINALDAAVQAYVNISTLRQALYPTDKIHGIITHGGDAPNVIPPHTSMSWYVRAATEERLDELNGRVLACFEAAAQATGCSWEHRKKGHPFRDLVTNPLLAEVFAANGDALGRDLVRGATLPPHEAGSTDMGNVSHVVPAIHPELDIKSAPATNHQRAFAAHTITPDGERAIRDGALLMAWSIIDLATENRWREL